MVKVCKKFQMAAKTGEFFALHEWNFHCENMKKLLRDLIDEDKTMFDFNIPAIDWDHYVKNYMLGIRTFVLKDNSETIQSARKKLNK